MIRHSTETDPWLTHVILINNAKPLQSNAVFYSLSLNKLHVTILKSWWLLFYFLSCGCRDRTQNQNIAWWQGQLKKQLFHAAWICTWKRVSPVRNVLCQDNFTKILCLTKQDHKQYHCILYCASIFIPPRNNKSRSVECMYLREYILFATKQWETNFTKTTFC